MGLSAARTAKTLVGCPASGFATASLWAGLGRRYPDLSRAFSIYGCASVPDFDRLPLRTKHVQLLASS